MKEKDIEKYITKIVNDFDPLIRKRFILKFADSYKKVLADTETESKPCVITFYLKTIKKAPDCSKELLQELINHEVLHTWFESHDIVTPLQGVVNFRIHKNQQFNLYKWRTNANN